MSVPAYFDGDYVDDAANSGGWLVFGKFVDDLPLAKFRDLIQLREHGWCDQIQKLRRQVKAAKKLAPNPAAGSAEVCDRLLEILAKAPHERARLSIGQ